MVTNILKNNNTEARSSRHVIHYTNRKRHNDGSSETIPSTVNRKLEVSVSDNLQNMDETNIPKTRIGNATAEKMASIKAHQEAFARRGQKTEENFSKIGRGNVAAERMASIRAQQEAFARKGQK